MPPRKSRRRRNRKAPRKQSRVRKPIVKKFKYRPYSTKSQFSTMSMGKAGMIQHQLLPQSYFATLTTRITGAFTAASIPANGDAWAVNANGMYKPWNVSGGYAFPSQTLGGATIATCAPFGFTQMMGTSLTTGLYNSYRVMGSRIKATFYVGNNNNDTLNVSLFPWPKALTALAASDTGDMAVMPFSKNKLFLFASPAKPITNRMSTAQIFGLTGQHVRDDDSYSCLYNTLPPANFVWYWVFGITTVGGGANTQAVDYDIEVQYDVIFEDSKISASWNNVAV